MCLPDRHLLSAVGALLVALCAVSVAPAQEFKFLREDARMAILVDGKPFATYVWNDVDLPRPYFCQILAPDGTPVTRHHPPDPEADKGNADHATYHPGVWLAFGDLGGADFWRNKARVRHVRFVREPENGAGAGQFTVLNAYETVDTPPRGIGEEICTYTVQALPAGWLLTSESEFRAASDGIVFGDQEEMGFGARVATPLTVKYGGGTLWNSEGGVDEKGTWGRTARWCAAAGESGDRLVGLALLVSPDNFRPSWFHTRDYGLIVANPFGKKAMTAPDDDAQRPDSTALNRGAVLRLDFGLFVFAAAQDARPDLETVWERFRERLRARE